MTVYRAAWVLPIVAPPIREGWILTGGGRIVAVGAAGDPRPPGAHGAAEVDLGEVAVMPALVNAHTHLELSWLRGRVAPAGGFLSWVSAMMRDRLTSADGRNPDGVRAAIGGALDEMRGTGTGVVGDISNGLEHLDLLDASGLSGVVFHETHQVPRTRPGRDRRTRRGADRRGDRRHPVATRPRGACALLGVASRVRGLAPRSRARRRSGRIRCMSPSRPRKSSSSAGAAAGGATC